MFVFFIIPSLLLSILLVLNKTSGCCSGFVWLALQQFFNYMQYI